VEGADQEAAEAAAVRRAGARSRSRYKNRYGRTAAYNANYEGVIPYLQRRHTEAESDSQREQIEGYMREVPCPTCEGPGSTRLARRHVDGHNIADIATVDRRGGRGARGLELSERDKLIAERVVKEINARWASCSTSASTT
jgi:excinuclease ABC subunit A